MNVVIYDAEIVNAIPPADPAERIAGVRYCEGWTDFAGMGIAVITAYDVLTARARVILGDNLQAFQDLVAQRDTVIGWNSHRFDDRLLEANGFSIPPAKSIDLGARIWRAAGIPQGEHPRGLGLDAVCQANGIPGKTGNGADAPIDWQAGRLGKVIDYCLGDTYSTLQLYRRVFTVGGCIDPRNHQWIPIGVLHG